MDGSAGSDARPFRLRHAHPGCALQLDVHPHLDDLGRREPQMEPGGP